jgi:hypothetical protein
VDLDSGDTSRWRPPLQPLDQLSRRTLLSDNQHFDTSVRQVRCKAVEAELNCPLARRRSVEHTLHET